MLLKVQTTSTGTFRPIKKINFPQGLNLIISIELPSNLVAKDLKSISEKSFGILKDEDWTALRSNLNKDINSRINKLWHVPS